MTEVARRRITAILDDIEATEWELRRLGQGFAARREPQELQEALEIIARIEAKLNGKPLPSSPGPAPTPSLPREYYPVPVSEIPQAKHTKPFDWD